jgi:TonB-linked SusC/RagA family outer membrane protein
VFPSIAAAWKVSEEPFMSAISAVSDLKIRGSWGKTGNQSITPFKYQGTYGTGTSLVDNRSYPFGTSKVLYGGIALQSIPNSLLQWEANEQTNIGIDASFLQGKITLTADYYNRVSSGFLIDAFPIPSQSGSATQTKNVGKLKNSGLELMLGYRKSDGNVQWGLSANVTTVNNKIESLGQGLKYVPNPTTLGFADYGAASWTIYSNSTVGGQIGSFYGFKADGIIQTQAELDALNAQAAAKGGAGTYYQTSTTAPGDRKFVDVDGDGKVTDSDRVNIGSPLPKFYGGINADVSYKNFDLTMFWYGTYGNKILNYAKRNLQSIATNGGVGLQNVSEDFYLNHWTQENHSNTLPRALRSDTPGNTRISDAYVENGSYLRLRNIQIGYSLPSDLLTKARITKMRIYVSAQNLFTITKYSGLDPEIGQVTDPNPGSNAARSPYSSGMDLGSYPNTRSYTLGLNLQF